MVGYGNATSQIETAVSAAATGALGDPDSVNIWLGAYRRDRNAEVCGERALLVELVERTRRDLTEDQRTRPFKDAVRWLQEREPERPMSFEWVCGALGWEPEPVRRALLNSQRWNGKARKAWRRVTRKRIGT